MYPTAQIFGPAKGAPGSTFLALRRKAAPAPGVPDAQPSHLASAAAGGADPMAGYSPGQIAQITGRYTAGLPAPLTDPQIRARAQGEIDPIIARITAAINSRARVAGSAITGYTDSLAKDLGAIDYGAPYAGAKEQQAAVDASLTQALSGGGTALAGDLKSRLAQIGEPGVVGQAGDSVAATGAANANTELTRGSSALSNLIAQAAAAEEYGVKQPGLARLAGQQDITGVQNSALQQIGDQTATVEQQLPGILNDFRSQSDSRAGNIVSARAHGMDTIAAAGRATATNTLAQEKIDSTARAKALDYIVKYGVDPATGMLTPTAQKLLAKVGVPEGALTGLSGSNVTSLNNNANSVAGADARSAASIAAADGRAAASRAQKAGAVSASVSKIKGVVSHADGTPFLSASGSTIPIVTSTKTISPAARSKLAGTALTIGETAFHGGKDAKGNVLPKLDYPDAILEGQKAGIPLAILLNGLNRFYQPGDRGRPETPATKKAAKFFDAQNPVWAQGG